MPTKPFSLALARETVETINQCYRDGFAPTGVLSPPPNANHEAARRLGLSSDGTIRSRLSAIKSMIAAGADIHLPDPSLWVDPNHKTYTEIHAPPAIKPKVRVMAPSQTSPPEGPVMRVLGIGDAHVKPGRPTEPLVLAGRHAAETKPDKIVSIGDWLSLDSCSFHPPKGSARDSERPNFHEDIAAGEESLHDFNKACPEDIERHITFGNHEHRAWRAADADPRLAGDFPTRLEEIFAQYRWKTYGYGKWLYLGGVGFVHVPLNAMGREYGGKHSENTIGNDATHSVVWGHDHRFRAKTVPKIGPNNRITLCNLGTCMPYGLVEDYSIGLTGWTYGVVDLRIQAGLIISAKFHDLLELRERYGD